MVLSVDAVRTPTAGAGCAEAIDVVVVEVLLVSKKWRSRVGGATATTSVTPSESKSAASRSTACACGTSTPVEVQLPGCGFRQMPSRPHAQPAGQASVSVQTKRHAAAVPGCPHAFPVVLATGF